MARSDRKRPARPPPARVEEKPPREPAPGVPREDTGAPRETTGHPWRDLHPARIWPD